MNLRSSSLLVLALPLTLATACGDDGTDPDQNGSTSGTPTTETDDPGTATDDPGTATDDPDTTTDDPGTTTDVDPDSSSGEPPMGEAGVRVLHLGVNAPGVDVFANGDGPIIDNLEFRNGTDYALVPPGDYTFQVSVTGTSADEAVLDPMLTLEDGASYTAVAIGDLNETDGAPGLQAIALVDDAADIDPANIRVTLIHAAPAVGEVDIWEITAEPVPLAENVPFGAAATLDDIPAGVLEVGIDVDDDAIPDLTFTVDATPLAGGQVNVYANNDAEGGVALIAQLQDGTVLPISPN